MRPRRHDGEIRDHIQTNGRCEASNARGDTYGPVNYLAYVPAALIVPHWSGKWDLLPAAHATAIAFDLLAVLGLVLVGLRFGGTPLAAALAFAWMAFPFTAYTMNANSNDTIMPAILIWQILARLLGRRRGVRPPPSRAGRSLPRCSSCRSGSRIPNGLRPKRHCQDLGLCHRDAGRVSILLFEPSLTHAVHVFVDHTIGYQLDRDSPFSPWDWGQDHARGIPSLRPLQIVLQLAVLALAGVVAMIPQRKGPLELAALSAAVLVGFELTLTHWSYLYIPWFLPFVLLAFLLPRREAGSQRLGADLRQELPAHEDVVIARRSPRGCRSVRGDARRALRCRSRGRLRDHGHTGVQDTASGSRPAICPTATSASSIRQERSRCSSSGPRVSSPMATTPPSRRS